MKVTRIKTTNFLSHRETELNLKSFDAVIAVGPNGSGKSTLMVDSMLVALFGKGRSGDLDGYISNGKDLMVVELDFSLGESHYRVIRKRSKKTARGSSSLEFFRIDNQGKEIASLTAGTIGETQEIIERTIGIDFDTLVRSSILEQGEADFFCRAAPSERMELFSKVWDLERYEAFAQMARDAVTGLKERIRVLDEQVARANQKLSEINRQKGELETIKKDLGPLAAMIVSLNEKRDKLQNQVGAFENLSKELARSKEYRARAEQEIKRLNQQHEEILARIEQFSKIVKNQETVRAKVTEEEEKNRELINLEAVVKDLNAGIEAIREEMDGVRKEYQDRLDMIEQDKAAVETDLSEMRAKERNLEKTIAEIGQKEYQLKHLFVDADKLAGVACHPDFDPEYVNETCRFIRDAVEAKRRIPELGSEISQNRAEITSSMATLRDQVGLFEEKRVGCISLQAETRNLLKQALSTHERRVSETTADRNGKEAIIRTLKEELVEIKRYTRLLPEIDLAEKELPGLKDQEKKVSQEMTDQVSERDRQTKEIEKLTEKLSGKARIERELQSIATKLTEVSGQRDDLTKRLGFIEAEIAQGEVLKKQTVEDEKGIEALESDRATYQLLEDAFKQIPYMLVARGIGAVERIANEILGMISSSGLTVTIATEKTTKTTKRVKDEINLIIQDSDGQKEYKFLSGGEKLRVALALRLAISEVLAHRRGTRIDSLIADEPFGPLDIEGIEDMKEALRELKKRFKFLGIITHIDRAQDIFPTRLVFSKGPEGSKVEVQEEYA